MIRHLRVLNKAAGNHFFDDDTMRFFNSRTHDIHQLGDYMGWLFVTSETPDYDTPRRYTVRYMYSKKAAELVNQVRGAEVKEGYVETVSGFCEFSTSGAANRAMAKMTFDDVLPTITKWWAEEERDTILEILEEVG